MCSTDQMVLEMFENVDSCTAVSGRTDGRANDKLLVQP